MSRGTSLLKGHWGDFQTPVSLAESIVASLPDRCWERVLEPTCGSGSFLTASSGFSSAERIGIEVQGDYAEQARDTGAQIIRANIFDLNLASDIPWASTGSMLVIGNPPWITNSEQGMNGGSNLPTKSNLNNLRGFDALTGSSNFDIAEYIWLKLIMELREVRPVIALLCKTQVARKVLSFCSRHSIPLEECSIRRIDAKQWFGVSVDACLFTVTVGTSALKSCSIFPSLEAPEQSGTIFVANGQLTLEVPSLGDAEAINGVSHLQWRQGVKHDAASVIELEEDYAGKLRNKRGDVVEVESEFVYPLLRATDLSHGRAPSGSSVIVTQRSLGEDTNDLEHLAPKLWAYLMAHAATLDARKSSIYVGRPRFAMFGIGDYSFAPWKVAVSGFHKVVKFRLVGPVSGRPVMLNDTCYFLPFNDSSAASLTVALLNSELIQRFLSSVVFTDAKRPVTKKVLQRVDITAAANLVDPALLIRAAGELVPDGVRSPGPDDLATVRATVWDSGSLALC